MALLLRRIHHRARLLLLLAPVWAVAQPASDPGPWWRRIDTGPFIADTLFAAQGNEVAALKGLAIKVGPDEAFTFVFDTELLAWRAGFQGTVSLAGTAWNGAHVDHTRLPAGAERFFFRCQTGRGAALNGDWRDARPLAAGPLPRNVARYRGLYRHGRQTVVNYTVGGITVWELPGIERIDGTDLPTRTVAFDATGRDRLELVAGDPPGPNSRPGVDARLVVAPPGVTLRVDAEGRRVVEIAPQTPAGTLKLVYGPETLPRDRVAPAVDPRSLTRGGPPLFAQRFSLPGRLDPDAERKTYAVDLIPLPTENPWRSPTRFGGFDFFADGHRIAASTWNGDVWIADGVDGDLSRVEWRRFAAGLFQPLGLKIVDGVIYTQGRDQITRLHDLNGDGEADFYECFNNDVMITSGFHEFSFDLQTDRDGNFYFAKAMPVLGGGRGFAPSTPHNGSVLKLSRDGQHLERVAWGLRAPGGLAVSPDGVVTTGENEGSFVPACKITWNPPGAETFNGVVPGRWQDRNWLGPAPGAPTDYARPLCWLPYSVDNSGGSQAWVPSGTAWDPRHAGELLHLSYGKSGIFRVLREEVDGVVQGGVYRLPIDLSAAVMRARFHPVNGQLYAIGFRGWQTNGRDAFQRVRFVGPKAPVPVALHAHRNGLLVRFSAPLDRAAAEDPSRYAVSKWNYVWGPQYGSGRFSIDERDPAAEEKALTVPSKGAHDRIDTMTVGAARLLEDGRSVFLYLPRMTAAMQMELKMDLVASDGARVRETLYHTVHAMRPEFTLPNVRWESVAVAASTAAGEPGLILTFTAETTDARRVDQMALTVPAGTTPSVFTPRRAFTAAWQGLLVIGERDDYTFSIEGAGSASLQIDGKVVASGELPLTAAAPVSLGQGTHAIYCSFSSRQDGDGRIRVMWSSPQFRPEPVPASAFRCFPGADLEAWTRARAGREVFAAAMCLRCHAPRQPFGSEITPELTMTAPKLEGAGRRLDPAWLAEWIAQPQRHCPTLPNAPKDDLLAALRAESETDADETSIAMTPEAIAAGGRLVEKLHLQPWIEPLQRERKHRDRGLVAWLRQPAEHDPFTLFPDLRLSEDEARLIAAFIRSRQPAAKPPASHRGNVAAGRTAVAALCSTCHAPGPSTRAAKPWEEIAKSDWAVRGCVAADRGHAPDLHLTAEENAVLMAFRQADRDVGIASLRRFVPAEYAESQMRLLNCAACHRGGGEDKIPSIARAGEKLELAWLTQLIAGQPSVKIRPWLEARMPAFASRAEKLALGLAARHGLPLESSRPAVDVALVDAGQKLAGSGGYACVTCHAVGTTPALQAFEGQGVNLQLSAARLRYDYFQRWMHFPQRIDPSTIMPRYVRERDRALLDAPFDGDAARQFEAIWAWMQSQRTDSTKR